MMPCDQDLRPTVCPRAKPPASAVRNPLIALLAATFLSGTALAVDNVLLIQLQSGGGFTVWHTEGESQLSDDEAMAIEATATPEGGVITPTPYGPARAFETELGVIIRLPEAKNDTALLLDRDNCNHVRLWHAAGSTQLTDDQITDIYMSAVPGGGPRLRIGDQNVKAYSGRLGVTASLWPVEKSH